MNSLSVHVVQLLQLLQEEQLREDQRDQSLDTCENEADMAALDGVFMLERAAANERIVQIVQ